MSLAIGERSRQEGEVQAQLERRLAITERLVSRLLADEPEQLHLFKNEREQDQVRHKALEELRKENPEKLVVDAEVIQKYRYEAAMYGAGFHPSQFDEITWQDNELAGTNTVWFDVLGGWHVRHEPARIGRSNRMRDEVSEELFTDHTSDTEYVLTWGVYMTNEDDLRKILNFDQMNLAGVSWLCDGNLLDDDRRS